MSGAQAKTHKAAPRETHTGDLNVGQQPDIILKGDDAIDHEQVIQPIDTPLMADHLKQLAFAEEPVTIRISKAAEKNAPIVVDCWVNGKGAEVLVNGKWIEFGCLPVDQLVTTKRKYVEVLARSKMDNVQTDVVKRTDSEDNIIKRSTSSKTVFSVIQDKSKFGHEWLTRLLQEG